MKQLNPLPDDGAIEGELVDNLPSDGEDVTLTLSRTEKYVKKLLKNKSAKQLAEMAHQQSQLIILLGQDEALRWLEILSLSQSRADRDEAQLNIGFLTDRCAAVAAASNAVIQAIGYDPAKDIELDADGRPIGPGSAVTRLDPADFTAMFGGKLNPFAPKEPIDVDRTDVIKS